jgi:hypothetical protein
MFVVEVITIGGDLPSFLEPPAPVVFSTLVVSVSMSVVLRGARNLRVNTAFGGSLTAADTGTGLVDFLAFYEVLLEICLLRLFTSWRSSSWAVDSTRGGPSRKPRFQEFLYCCITCSLSRKCVYRPVHRNGRPFWRHYSGLSPHVAILEMKHAWKKRVKIKKKI